MKKLKRILLIDDDRLTNMMNVRLLKPMDISEEIREFTSAEKALEYLHTRLEEDRFPAPDLIFLDINMPIMNGWEFLEEYNKLDKEQQGAHVVLMLTSSPNPDDISRAKTFSNVNGYLNKPLSPKMVEDVLAQHFPDVVPTKR